jgi:small-conductance mechanosensitive channel
MEEKRNKENDDPINSDRKEKRTDAKRRALKRVVVMAAVLIFSLSISTLFLRPLIPVLALQYVQIAQIAIIGYFFIEIVSEAVYRLTSDYFLEAARSIKAFIRIASAIIIVAIIISYLSQNPIVAASIGTISALVVGFASQAIIGNMIAGLYLSVTRPFRIGDRITVFGNTGTIFEMGLLYSRLILDNGDTVLASNSSLVTTTIILHHDKGGNSE